MKGEIYMKEDRKGDIIWKNKREEFEQNKRIYESKILEFSGIKANEDVYNCSIPFIFNEKTYIFGRVEPQDKWATSRVYLFEKTGEDSYTAVKDALSYRLEDPFITYIDNKLIFGGVEVLKMRGVPVSYRTCFFDGSNPFEMEYFTTGPEMMKDIRLVQLPNGIGVFSRPDGYVGFTVIKDITELDENVIKNAPIIDFIGAGGYGGINQALYLDSGLIGLIGHIVYPSVNSRGQEERAYINTASVFDPKTGKTLETKIIGTRTSYPASERVRKTDRGIYLEDVAFTSGIVARNDKKVDLYSGLSDSLEGRITIDYPFAEYGKVISL